VKDSIIKGESLLHLGVKNRYEKSLRPITAKETNKKINLGGTQIMFKKQSEVNPPSDEIDCDPESEEKSIPQEEKKEDFILAAQCERTEEEEKKLNDKGSVNKRRLKSEQAEVAGEQEPADEPKASEESSEDDEDVASDTIELNHKVQSKARNIKLQQMKFVTDAENGLSHERMDYVTTRTHPHINRKSGIILVH